MAERGPLSPRGLRFVGLALAAGALAGLVAVYVSGGFHGNGGGKTASNCVASDGAALKPYAKGEVAAFQVVRSPADFSTLAFRDPKETNTTLASLAGRTVLVNLWATWCVPCRTEMPALDRLQAELGGDNFTVAAINIDIGEAGLARARAFLDRAGIKNLALFSDPTTKIFGDLRGRGLALGLPTTLLVDVRGCAIGVLQGPAEWDSDDGKTLIKAAIAAGAA